MLEGFYYFPYPLCQQDVDVSQPNCYRVLPVDSERKSLFNKKPVCNEYESIIFDDIRFTWNRKGHGICTRGALSL